MDDDFGLRKPILIAIAISVAFSLPYFVIFSGGFSSDSNDWGNFGAFIAGIVTIPLTSVSIFVLFKNYTIVKNGLELERIRTFKNNYLVAITHATESLERGLSSKTKVGQKEFTLYEVFSDDTGYNSIRRRLVNDLRMGEKNLYINLKVRLIKPMIALYDVLINYEDVAGTDPFLKSVKIRYQHLYSFILDDEIGKFLCTEIKNDLTLPLIVEYFNKVE